MSGDEDPKAVEARMDKNEEPPQCNWIDQTSGRRCVATSLFGYLRCAKHLVEEKAAPEPPPEITTALAKLPPEGTNLPGLAIHSAQRMSPTERYIYDLTRKGLVEEYPELDKGADAMMLHLVCFHFARFQSLLFYGGRPLSLKRKGKEQQVEEHEHRVSVILSQLGIRRDVRKKVEAPPKGRDPANLNVLIMEVMKAKGSDDAFSGKVLPGRVIDMEDAEMQEEDENEGEE